MGDYTFAKEYSLEKDLIEFVLSLKKTNLINARLVISEYYEYKTKIYNHVQETSKRPLSSIAFHDAEDITNNSLLEDSFKSYIKHDIKNIFGLNLVEYLNLPLDIINLMEKIAISEIKTKNSALSKLHNELTDLEQQQ